MEVSQWSLSESYWRRRCNHGKSVACILFSNYKRLRISFFFSLSLSDSMTSATTILETAFFQCLERVLQHFETPSVCAFSLMLSKKLISVKSDALLNDPMFLKSLITTAAIESKKFLIPIQRNDDIRHGSRHTGDLRQSTRSRHTEETRHVNDVRHTSHPEALPPPLPRPPKRGRELQRGSEGRRSRSTETGAVVKGCRVQATIQRSSLPHKCQPVPPKLRMLEESPDVLLREFDSKIERASTPQELARVEEELLAVLQLRPTQCCDSRSRRSTLQQSCKHRPNGWAQEVSKVCETESWAAQELENHRRLQSLRKSIEIDRSRLTKLAQGQIKEYIEDQSLEQGSILGTKPERKTRLPFVRKSPRRFTPLGLSSKEILAKRQAQERQTQERQTVEKGSHTRAQSTAPRHKTSPPPLRVESPKPSRPLPPPKMNKRFHLQMEALKMQRAGERKVVCGQVISRY
eukprot:Blabericola_migrator_1__842@NODE_1207_length_5107_cov_164_727183_g764_i1_p1_GENE_NODE_1207_length_5107_cov_164_727183_g764_i1NODE_1207_length_5107_cov_164_727183_g764_i1_p1_ORF_typecomplete_len462_score79_87_NODE_1207_length_5107_cov_164_727183_g764_i133884773